MSKQTVDISKPKLTRNQARKVVIDFIAPYLLSEGFSHQKNLRFWRITTNKTDVIELRFLLNSDPTYAQLPQSTFSVLGGCYFNYIPNAFDEKIIQQIPNIVTPCETHCHLRFTVKTSLRQPLLNGDNHWWHLDCDDIEVAEVLSDVQAVLKNQLLPLMKKYGDTKEFLDLLESQNQVDFNLGIGKPDSFNRQYLLGFTYLELGDKKLALECLKKAKKIQDELLIKVKGAMNLKSEAPLIKQSESIQHALDALKKNVL